MSGIFFCKWKKQKERKQEFKKRGWLVYFLAGPQEAKSGFRKTLKLLGKKRKKRKRKEPGKKKSVETVQW